MQRWRGAALAVALCSGCLDPLVDDQPGYGRLVLPPGTQPTTVYEDPLILRKIDMNDGVGMGPIPIKNGFAAGSEVKFWDFGTARRPAPAYVLLNCTEGRPTGHAPIIESIPGDVDYSPFRAIFNSCVTPKYAGQVLPSSEALDEAVEIGLITEPVAANVWRNMPVVKNNVELSFGASTRRASEAYYEGKIVSFHQFADQEGEFANPSMLPTPGFVFEIVRPDAPTTVVRTIFSQPYRLADGSRNPAYTPQWTVVTLTLRPLNAAIPTDQQDEADELARWTKDADIVTYGMSGPVKRDGSRIQSLVVTAGTRANRPFLINPVGP
jgi:hypothetical protein